MLLISNVTFFSLQLDKINFVNLSGLSHTFVVFWNFFPKEAPMTRWKKLTTLVNILSVSLEMLKSSVSQVNSEERVKKVGRRQIYMHIARKFTFNFQ